MTGVFPTPGRSVPLAARLRTNDVFELVTVRTVKLPVAFFFVISTLPLQAVFSPAHRFLDPMALSLQHLDFLGGDSLENHGVYP